MKRFAKPYGVIAAFAVFAAVVVLLLRGRLATTPQISADEPSPFPAGSADRPASPPPDDLTAVSGIGPVYGGRLAAAGISTFAELAATSPSVLAGHTGASERRTSDWVEQASALATD